MMKDYDILIIGGGFSGTMSAIAAARTGKKVLLVEKTGALGGAACINYVLPFMHYTTRNEKGEKLLLSRGLFKEFIERLRAYGAIDEGGSTYNEEYVKLVLDEMTDEYGVEVLFHTTLVSAEVLDGNIESVTLFNVEGQTKRSAKIYIDASGDGTLFYLAGAPYKIGRKKDNKCQPMTLCFRMGNVDVDAFYRNDYEQLNRLWREKQKNGELLNPREDILPFVHSTPDVLHLNSTRVLLSPVNATEKSQAEKLARKQMLELYLFLKKHAPSCKSATLLSSSVEIGVRESRLLDGEYTLTEQDVISCKKFEDAIAAGNYEIDIHSPDGSGTYLVYIPEGEYYTIPYRACLPKKINNMLVVGRCISSTHEAQAAYRIMPIVACIGEGAGIAAAAALELGVSVKDIPLALLRKKIDERDLVEGYRS